MFSSAGCLAFDPAGDHALHDVFLHKEEHHDWRQDIDDRAASVGVTIGKPCGLTYAVISSRPAWYSYRLDRAMA